MKFVECPKCNKAVEPSHGHRCPECKSFLHPDPIKRFEADMAAKVRQRMIEELPKLGWVLPSDYTLDPEKLEALSFEELVKVSFRVIEPKIVDYTDSDMMNEPVDNGLTEHIMERLVDYWIKFTALGEGESGKTAYLQAITTQPFPKDYKMTLGVDLHTKTMGIQPKKGRKIGVQVQFWDMAGQPHFEYLRTQYYRGSMGALLFFNRERYDTFKHLDTWLDEFNQVCLESPCVLVGLLVDNGEKLEENRVSQDEVEAFVVNHQIPYCEVTLSDKLELDVPYLKLLDMFFEQLGWS